MKYGYKVEYVLKDDGDTTILTSKKAVKDFTKVVTEFGGYIVRERKVILAS